MAEQLQACCEAIVNPLNHMLSPSCLIKLYCRVVQPIAACFRSNRNVFYIEEGNDNEFFMLEFCLLIISCTAALPSAVSNLQQTFC